MGHTQNNNPRNQSSECLSWILQNSKPGWAAPKAELSLWQGLPLPERVALSVHQIVHDITLPFGVQESPDSVCGCTLNLQRGRWPSFGYMRRGGETDRIWSSEIWKVGDILYCGGISSCYETGFTCFKTLKGPMNQVLNFHNSFKQGSLVDNCTSCPGCKGWCGRWWQSASSFWCQIALSSLTWTISQVCSLCVIQPSTAGMFEGSLDQRKSGGWNIMMH